MEPLLERLGRTEHLDVWRSDELWAALAVIDRLDAERRSSVGGPPPINIRLAVYRRRLESELDRR